MGLGISAQLLLAVGAGIGDGPQLQDLRLHRLDLCQEATLSLVLFLDLVHDLLELPLPVDSAPPAGLVVEVAHAAVLLVVADVLRNRGKRDRVAGQRRATATPEKNQETQV